MSSKKIQIVLRVVGSDDDPRIVLTIRDATGQNAPEGQQLIEGKTGAISPDAERDIVLEGELLDTLKTALEQARTREISSHNESLAQAEIIESRVKLIADRREKFRLLPGFVRHWARNCATVLQDVDDQSPIGTHGTQLWRFSVRVITKALEALAKD